MKIVILDGGIANPGDLSWQQLEALGELTVYNDTPKEKVVERITDAEAVITNKVVITGEMIAASHKLAYIGLLSTGYNQIDIEAAGKRGIPVCNVPSYSTEAVAQHTIALLLEICNNVGQLNRAVHAGRWGASKQWSFWDTPLTELYGKVFGVIGFGRIGQAAGRIAKALGMRVIATGSRPTETGKQIAEYMELEPLLAKADVVSLHSPLLPATEGIINAKNIAKMKQGTILLNTARGGLVVEKDLADALNSGKLRAAGLDVTAVEPIADDSPLLGAQNCFITPHVAWVAPETRQRLLNTVVENLRAFQKGTPQNTVNKY